MCPTEKIPAVDCFHRIRQALEQHQETSNDGHDVLALDRDLRSNGEVVEDMNVLTNNIDPETFYRDLPNQGRVMVDFELPSDYEDVFLIPELSRRDERPSGLPGDFPVLDGDEEDQRQQSCRDLMRDWMSMCVDASYVLEDQYMPGDMEPFADIMIESMPARLTIDSWIVEPLLAEVSYLLTGRTERASEFQIWQEGYGKEDAVLVTTPDGAVQPVLPFIGEPQPGRLIWRPPGGFSQEFVMENDIYAIRLLFKKVELAIVALGRRIARHVATCILFQYVFPKEQELQRCVLNRAQIGRAVREILGEEWFDLPFDTEDSLCDWSIEDVLDGDPVRSDQHIIVHELWVEEG